MKKHFIPKKGQKFNVFINGTGKQTRGGTCTCIKRHLYNNTWVQKIEAIDSDDSLRQFHVQLFRFEKVK